MDEVPDYEVARMKKQERVEHMSRLKPGQYYLVQEFNHISTIKKVKEEVQEVTNDEIFEHLSAFYETSEGKPPLSQPSRKKN